MSLIPNKSTFDVSLDLTAGTILCHTSAMFSLPTIFLKKCLYLFCVCVNREAVCVVLQSSGSRCPSADG